MVTTWSATDDAITFDETGQYQFVIKKQNCTASVRRTRYFKLLQREGEQLESKRATATRATASPAKDTKPDTQAERDEPKPLTVGEQRKPQENRCAEPGPPARLEVRPSRKLMRPGERFSFRSVVLDKKGCRLAWVVPAWRLLDPKAPAQLVAPGRLAVDKDAPEGEITLSASVHGQAVRVVVEIAPHERYEALLRQKGLDPSGESRQAAAAAIASGSIGTRSAVTQEDNRTLTRSLAAIVGLVLLAGAAAAWILVRRHRGRATAGAGDVVPMRGASDPFVGGRSSAPSVPPVPRAKICPVCGTQFDASAEYCGLDGAVLVPEN